MYDKIVYHRALSVEDTYHNFAYIHFDLTVHTGLGDSIRGKPNGPKTEEQNEQEKKQQQNFNDVKRTEMMRRKCTWDEDEGRVARKENMKCERV